MGLIAYDQVRTLILSSGLLRSTKAAKAVRFYDRMLSPTVARLISPCLLGLIHSMRGDGSILAFWKRPPDIKIRDVSRDSPARPSHRKTFERPCKSALYVA